jgi:hypothetical protein
MPDRGLRISIHTIDPHPNGEINPLCDEVT